ncbi:phzS, partial [Symbiodinium microadriaticum]
AASALREIGAGINVQAVAVGALIDLGIDLEKFHDQEQGDSILTSSVEYFTSDGIFIASEAVGREAGAPHPQLSAHRAKFHSTLVAECRRLLGEEQLILNHSFVSFEQMEDGRLSLHFESTDAQQALPPVACDFLVAADGLKSRVRASLLGSAEPRYTGRTIYRGLCEVDAVSGDGRTVSLCGDQNCNFICYPISEKLRAQGRFHCNWGFCTLRPHPGGVESWTSLAKLEELERMGANSFAGLSPLQMAERSDSIIGWALFDRDPLETFDFGNVTLLGDAAHPLLPYGSQGATQAIMDAEALGVCYQGAMQSGTGIHGCIKAYSDLRCEVTGKVVIANREMGSTAVLKVVDEQTQGMDLEAKRRWCAEHGSRLHDEVIQKYRASMPKSVRATKLPSAASA